MTRCGGGQGEGSRGAEWRRRWSRRLLKGVAAALLLALAAAGAGAQSDPSGKNQAGSLSPADAALAQSLPAASPRGATAALVLQIDAILRNHPEAMADAKIVLGRTVGADPETIADDQVYERVLADAEFRAELAADLEGRGYQLNAAVPNQGDAGGAGAGNSAAALAAPQPESDAERPLLQRRNPYPNVPSLRDLYQQYPEEGGKFRRFGSEVFLVGSGNARDLPMDLPAGPDYVLGPGDVLMVNLWGSQAAQLSRIVDRQGQIALPEAGMVAVAGLKMEQAEKAVARVFQTQLSAVHVALSLGRVRTVRVYVVGDVQKPGAFDLSSLSTPLNALYAAGGPTARGSLRTLRHLRGQQLIEEIDLYDFLLHGVRTGVARLEPGDTILVPPAGPQVTVTGMVKRPAIYEMKGPLDLAGALELAGGVQVTANLKQVRVERIEAHERRTMLSAELGAGPLPGFAVSDGDRVIVAPILPFREDVVYLDGHVFRPGRYPWRQGMTVTDLLHSSQEILPEPARHAEIIRLAPPDLRPETIGFDLPEALAGQAPPALQPYDVVRIYSRYEIDPPKVTIAGEVLRPGPYPMSEGMTLAALVRMAGGLLRSAYGAEADLTSYEIERDEKVLVRHQVVDLARALQGEKGADPALQAGDVVGIRQKTGWKDIGASMTLAGEVRFAGTYGIEEGERLSSVLKRAGGLRASAFPAGAVLERVQLRQAEENSREELIRRVEASAPQVSAAVGTPAQEQLVLLQSLQQQQQQVLAALRSYRPSGRLVVKIGAEIARWENTAADIELRAGDRLTIPKRPDFVAIVGQVYNSTGISFTPGKDAGWYLEKAGGATRLGDKRNILILRADGSVASAGRGLFGEGVLRTHINRGDSIVVPEKVVGGSQAWKNLLGVAQAISSVAITGAVAGLF